MCCFTSPSIYLLIFASDLTSFGIKAWDSFADATRVFFRSLVRPRIRESCPIFQPVALYHNPKELYSEAGPHVHSQTHSAFGLRLPNPQCFWSATTFIAPIVVAETATKPSQRQNRTRNIRRRCDHFAWVHYLNTHRLHAALLLAQRCHTPRSRRFQNSHNLGRSLAAWKTRKTKNMRYFCYRLNPPSSYSTTFSKQLQVMPSRKSSPRAQFKPNMNDLMTII